jgi:hypothetical protein
MNSQPLAAFGFLTSLALSFRVGYYFQSTFLVVASLLLGAGIVLISLVVSQMEPVDEVVRPSKLKTRLHLFQVITRKKALSD